MNLRHKKLIINRNIFFNNLHYETSKVHEHSAYGWMAAEKYGCLRLTLAVGSAAFAQTNEPRM